jgi:hypothetical protein
LHSAGGTGTYIGVTAGARFNEKLRVVLCVMGKSQDRWNRNYANKKVLKVKILSAPNFLNLISTHTHYYDMM